MKTMKGPGLFLAQFAGKQRTVQFPRRHLPLGCVSRLQGRSDTHMDARLFDLRRSRRVRCLLRRHHGDGAASRPRNHRIINAPSRTVGCGSSRFRRGLRRFCGAGGQGQSQGPTGMGCRAIAVGGEGLQAIGLKRTCEFFRCSRMALHVPVATTPGGLVETAFQELGRRWLPILNAFDEAGCDLCYEIHPGEDLHDGATFERFVDTPWAATSARVSTTIRATFCYNNWIISPLSISITSELRRSTSRMRSSIPPGGSASMAVMRLD